MALLSRSIGESPPADSLVRYLWRSGLALRNRAEEAEDGKAKRQPTLEEFVLQCGRVFSLRALQQLRVLCLGLLQDGDVGVGVFPDREEILISTASFCRIAGEAVG